MIYEHTCYEIWDIISLNVCSHHPYLLLSMQRHSSAHHSILIQHYSFNTSLT